VDSQNLIRLLRREARLNFSSYMDEAMMESLWWKAANKIERLLEEVAKAAENDNDNNV